MNWVSKREHWVLSLEKPAFFILATRKDVEKKNDLFLKKHNNNHFFACKRTDQQR